MVRGNLVVSLGRCRGALLDQLGQDFRADVRILLAVAGLAGFAALALCGFGQYWRSVATLPGSAAAQEIPTLYVGGSIGVGMTEGKTQKMFVANATDFYKYSVYDFFKENRSESTIKVFIRVE